DFLQEFVADRLRKRQLADQTAPQGAAPVQGNAPSQSWAPTVTPEQGASVSPPPAPTPGPAAAAPTDQAPAAAAAQAKPTTLTEVFDRMPDYDLISAAGAYQKGDMKTFREILEDNIAPKTQNFKSLNERLEYEEKLRKEFAGQPTVKDYVTVRDNYGK